jgi:hypothetical protein
MAVAKSTGPGQKVTSTPTPGRNDPCPCGSNRKYKKCCAPVAPWRRYEQLVAEVQAHLAPSAKVEHNVRLVGRSSGTVRQIDVVMRAQVGQFDVLLVLDCKDYGHPVDINDVEAFMGLAQDVGANKSGMVAARGFTAGAVNRAKQVGMDLLSLVHTGDHEWRTFATLPVLVEIRTIGSCSFKFSSQDDNVSLSSEVVANPASTVIYDGDGHRVGTPVDLLARRWNLHRLPVDPGVHPDLVLSDEPLFMRGSLGVFRILITTKIEVIKQRFVGPVPLDEVRGFKDEITGRLHTAGFSTETINFATVVSTWKKLETDTEMAVQPALTIELISVLPTGSQPDLESAGQSGITAISYGVDDD